MPQAAAITMENVSSRYEDGPLVLRDAGLKVPAGGFHAIVGPSGCGKSTLLRLVAGLLAPVGGRVEVASVAPVAGTLVQTGFVFQEPTLLPWLDVRANIALPLRLAGVARRAREARAAELAASLGLGDCLDYYPRQLSGGMKMRASLARALSTEPALMLFDEPFSGLDAQRRDALGEDILALWEKQGWTALFVTHSVTEAVFLSQRVHVMSGKPGHVAASLDVDLPGARGAALRSEARFHELVARVSALQREAAS
jgi:NitT/TauT family transport system ATP-binding protein